MSHICQLCSTRIIWRLWDVREPMHRMNEADFYFRCCVPFDIKVMPDGATSLGLHYRTRIRQDHALETVSGTVTTYRTRSQKRKEKREKKKKKKSCLTTLNVR